MKWIFCIFLVVFCQSTFGDDIEEDARLTTIELLRKYGYPAEDHTVRTSDGYILGVHRVPNPGKPVAFLMHGMLSSSADYVLMGPRTSLAYMLHDQGYDVWMGNARGNRYSLGHETLNPNVGAEYWRFSWNEIGVYDLPAMIDYVLAQTGRTKLHYIGHSQGTTVFWVMCAERPEYNDKVIAMQALAPAAFMHNTLSPYARALATWLTTTEMAFEQLGMYSFAPSDEMNAQGGMQYCKDGAITQIMCANVLFLIAGYNSVELNTTMLPVIMGHSPAGASSRQMIHFGQIIRSFLFRKFDYGVDNYAVYGQLTPPFYNLAKTTTPVNLYWGYNDWLATPTDVALLSTGLSNVAMMYQIPMLLFNHLDFVWAINVRSLVYNKLLQTMALYN